MKYSPGLTNWITEVKLTITFDELINTVSKIREIEFKEVS